MLLTLFHALIAYGALSSGTAGTMPQVKPTAEQLKEIQKAIDEVKDALKGKDKDKIKEAKDKAIKLTEQHFKIPADNLEGEPEYDPDEKSEGASVPSKKNKQKVKVTLGEKAFF